MDAVTKVGSSQTSQAVSSGGNSDSGTGQTPATGDFSTLLNSLMVADKDGNVSEEELFAATLVQRIGALKGDAAAGKFKDLLQQTETNLTKGGYVPYEDAARVALKQFRDSGELTAEEADKVHSEAFAAAQLDTNTNVLYDGIGGANDPTRAVEKIAAAILAAQAAVQKIESGAETLVSRSLASAFDASGSPISNPYDTAGAFGGKMLAGVASGPLPSGSFTPKGTKIDGADGFLFKPISEHGKKLVVLIPISSTVNVASVQLKDSTGKVLENGYHWNGARTPEPSDSQATSLRTKFEFKKPGRAYPKNVSVEVTYTDGSTAQYAIPDPSKRYD